MSNSLTVEYQIALFQVIEVPFYDQTVSLYPDGALGNIHDVTGSSRSSKTLILNHLTVNIYPDNNVMVYLQGKLDDWIALGEDTTRIEGGSVGNVTGIIRRKILVLVPFYRCHETMQRGVGTSIPIIR